MLVWNLEKQQWVELRSWMRWCPDIVTRPLKLNDEDWKNLNAKDATVI